MLLGWSLRAILKGDLGICVSMSLVMEWDMYHDVLLDTSPKVYTKCIASSACCQGTAAAPPDAYASRVAITIRATTSV